MYTANPPKRFRGRCEFETYDDDGRTRHAPNVFPKPFSDVSRDRSLCDGPPSTSPSQLRDPRTKRKPLRSVSGRKRAFHFRRVRLSSDFELETRYETSYIFICKRFGRSRRSTLGRRDARTNGSGTRFEGRSYQR